MKCKSLMWILWPSFLIAGLASAFTFALIDPLDVAVFGYIRPDRNILYAAGFFFFWLMGALSSVLTLYLMPKPGDGQNDIPF